MDYPRTPREVVGRPSLSVVGLRQGTQPHSDVRHGETAIACRIWRLGIERARSSGESLSTRVLGHDELMRL